MITYDFINTFIDKTIREDSGLLKEIRKYADLNKIPIIKNNVAKLLEVLCLIKKPKRVLEIGTAIGYSSILFAMNSCKDVLIETIEKKEENAIIAKKNILKAGFKEKINIILGEAEDILPCINKKYDIIFIDAAKARYNDFLPHCLRLLKENGIIIADNILYNGIIANVKLSNKRDMTIVRNMRVFLKRICNDKNLNTAIIPIGDGVSITFLKDLTNDNK